MRAFHSTWTKPSLLTDKDRPFVVDDFELLTTILSALKWRQFNGSIQMVTDERGAAYYKQLGIESIWDEGIDVCLDHIPNTINPNLFWAAGKLYSLKEQQTPCVMIDTDFIVWENIRNQLVTSELAVIHREQLEECVYPNQGYFHMEASYEFPKQGWDELACNTALTYFSDVDFKDTYVQEAISFMEAVKDGTDRITYMVFAEQRMLALIAKKMNRSIKELMPLSQLMSSGAQQTYTHIWGYKQKMRNNPHEREQFCKRCIHRIVTDFPEYEEMLWQIPVIEHYMKEE